jgi:predicted DNA-binding protein YlxM (UPF0122 family)
MIKVEDKIVLMELYDLYQNLLTDKQRGYFEAAYYDDMSITEIADEFHVSRNAVHDQLKKTTAKLNDIEDAVHLRKTNMKLNSLFETLKKIESKEKIIEMIEEYEKVE